MNRSMPLLCTAALALGGCLENKEQITIAEDGSVQIRVSAEGDRTDLADGSPNPQFGPWQAVDEQTTDRFGNVFDSLETKFAPLVARTIYQRMQDYIGRLPTDGRGGKQLAVWSMHLREASRQDL